MAIVCSFFALAGSKTVADAIIRYVFFSATAMQRVFFVAVATR